MSKHTLQILAVVLGMMVCLSGRTVMAFPNFAVGPATCLPSLPHFPTIQAAVSGVPPGATVMVCPGSYPEQVVISQPLTLEGVISHGQGAAVITLPPNGLLPNATTTFYGASAVQLLVENTNAVTINNIIVDGSGGGCVNGANVVIGIELFQVGIPSDITSAGKVMNSVVRNENNSCGQGIWTETSFVTIQGNDVHNVGSYGLYNALAPNNIISNFVSNAYVGLWLDGAVGTTISGNTMSNLSGWGMEIHHSGPPVTISKNSLLFTGFLGIDLYYAPSTITQNSTLGDPYGVELFNSPGSSIKSNAFTNLSYGAGVWIDDNGTAGGNTVAKNTINEAPCGINATYAIGDMLTPNTFFNVTSPICP